MWVSKAIRVRYENGVLKPLEPIDFKEEEQVVWCRIRVSIS